MRACPVIDDVYGSLRIGQRRESAGRTITETDVVHFCMLTGNWLGLHADAEFARTTRYGQRVAQGSLVFSIANALIPFDPDVVDAFVGVDELRFLAPTFIGDTLRSSAEVVQLRESGSGGGVATLLLRAHNQREQVVMSCRFMLRVRRDRLRERPDAPEDMEGSHVE